MYDTPKLQWCTQYIEMMRKIELQKFDRICAHILEFIELHTKLTKEEIDKLKDNTKTRGKGDLT